MLQNTRGWIRSKNLRRSKMSNLIVIKFKLTTDVRLSDITSEQGMALMAVDRTCFGWFGGQNILYLLLKSPTPCPFSKWNVSWKLIQPSSSVFSCQARNILQEIMFPTLSENCKSLELKYEEVQFSDLHQKMFAAYFMLTNRSAVDW